MVLVKEEVPQPLSRDALHAISSEFLSSEKLALAPISEKKDFLKTKGLSEDEIDTLLQKAAKGKGKEVASSSEASSRALTPASSDAGSSTDDATPAAETSQSQSLVPRGLKEIKPSPPPSPRLAPMEPTHLQQPLIVTYPEFLAPPPQPPAPITAKSLLSTIYYSAAAATTIYAGSKYILQPMYDQLTAARTDLAKTTLTNLALFNHKLSALVPSHVRPAIHPPQYYTSTGAGSSADTSPDGHLLADDSDAEAAAADNDDDDNSDDDDNASTTSSLRTHLFHVDASTQTTPDPLSTPAPTPTSEEKITTITTHLTTLIDSNSDGADGELQYELEALATYLETLRVDPKDLFPWGSLGGGVGGVGGAGGVGGKEDLTVAVKKEIRSVKGVLLNSKNFPGAR